MYTYGPTAHLRPHVDEDEPSVYLSIHIHMRKRASVYNHYTPRTRTSSSFFSPRWRRVGERWKGWRIVIIIHVARDTKRKKKEDERTIKNTKERRKTTRGPEREKGWQRRRRRRRRRRWWLFRASFGIIVVRRAAVVEWRGVVWRPCGVVYARANGYRETIRRDNEKMGNN
jgi:hypothetical protein